jgi:hypothetical protein
MVIIKHTAQNSCIRQLYYNDNNDRTVKSSMQCKNDARQQFHLQTCLSAGSPQTAAGLRLAP